MKLIIKFILLEWVFFERFSGSNDNPDCGWVQVSFSGLVLRLRLKPIPNCSHNNELKSGKHKLRRFTEIILQVIINRHISILILDPKSDTNLQRHHGNNQQHPMPPNKKRPTLQLVLTQVSRTVVVARASHMFAVHQPSCRNTYVPTTTTSGKNFITIKLVIDVCHS